jgi:hypothetical protein
VRWIRTPAQGAQGREPCISDGRGSSGARRLRLRTHGTWPPARHNFGVNIIQRSTTAALAVALGLAALLVGASLLMLRDGGWPWHAGITDSAGIGSTTAEIVDEDGTAYRFTGSSTEAQHWLDRKQDELKDAHGIATKIAVGRVLQPVGLVLVLLGLTRLLWRLTTIRRATLVAGSARR